MSFEWEISELGKEAINASRPFPFKEHLQVIFVNTGDVLSGDFLHSNLSCSNGLPGQAKKALKKHDILLSEIRPGNGRYAYVDFDVSNYVVSTKFMVIESLGRIFPRFLYHVLTNQAALDEFQRIAESRSGTFPQITFDAISHFPVPIPPKVEQEKLVNFFDALDDRITLLRETNVTLEAIAQALFKSWFVDFDPVRAKMEGHAPDGMDEATAVLFPDEFEASELGLVPKGWRVTPVGEVVTVTDYVANGSFAALKENVTLLDAPSYALYVRTTDYNSGFSGGFRYVDKSAYDFLSKSSLDGSEVIISNVGDVGTVFRPPKWIGLPMTLGSNAVALKRPDMSAYLYFHFSGPLGQHDIQSIITGSAQLKFNKTNFRALRLLIPSDKCLSAFEEVANSLLSRIENNRAQVQTFTSLRDTLLPRLISGQLRLPEAQSMVESV